VANAEVIKAGPVNVLTNMMQKIQKNILISLGDRFLPSQILEICVKWGTA
jgi:hypothetical protein